MLKKKYRLKSRSSFQYIYRKGKSVSSPYAVLKYVPARNLKIGFSVSKSIGNAVVRNTVKRRLRECVRPLVPDLKGSFNCILSARPAIVNAQFADLCSCVFDMLKGEGLLGDKE